jgi:predicted nucleic acid-binding protein
MPSVLVDAGPLVALVVRSDPAHDACVRALARIRGGLVTVWPAVTEAMHLTARYEGANDAVWGLLESTAIAVARLDEDDVPRLRALMAKYDDLPMDLADAAIVRVAERERIRTVFTVDRRDFQVYRPSRIGRFTIVP